MNGMIMKKLTALALAVAGFSAPAFAATVGSGFDVSVTLTSVCQVQTAATNVAFGTYVAFRTTDLTAPASSVVFRCTRGLPTPTVEFDVTNGTTSTTASTATAEGVLKGLRYILSAAAGTKTTTGAGASAGALGTGGSNGSADQYTYGISGVIPLGQAGTGPDGAANHTRTITVTY